MLNLKRGHARRSGSAANGIINTNAITRALLSRPASCATAHKNASHDGVAAELLNSLPTSKAAFTVTC
jgi:hypothetical protein